MNPKVYILTFDPHVDDAEALHRVITTMPLIQSWWHYIGSTYLMTSNSSAYDIETYVHGRWRGRFFVVEIVPRQTGGWLPREAWKWINSK